MMMKVIRKKPYNLLSVSKAITHKTLISTSTIQNPPPKPHFMVEYLINSCGFSPSRATSALKHFAGLKSLTKPEAVLDFLRRSGFGDAHITKLLSTNPRFLLSNAEKTLKPKIESLKAMGFSEPDLVELVSNNPVALRIRDMKPKIDFLRALVGTDAALLRACNSNYGLLCASLNKTIAPNVALLREHGVSHSQIAKVVTTLRIVGSSRSTVVALFKRVQELGFHHRSTMYYRGLKAVSSISRATLDAKLEMFKSLGWSEADTMTVIRKQPTVLTLTDENLRGKMEFYAKEVGFEFDCIVRSPVLLMLSLEKRLRPRWAVLRAVKGNKLRVAKTYDFIIGEESFVERYLVPWKEKFPGLYEAYVEACASKAVNSRQNRSTRKKNYGCFKKFVDR